MKLRHVIPVLGLFAGLLAGCSFNPNVRKQQHFDNGQLDFQKAEYPKAATEFTDAIKIDPEFAEAHFQLAQTFLKLQQPDRAYKELSDTIGLRPADYQARIIMANLLIAAGRLSEAQEQTNLLLKEQPNDPAVHSAASSLLAAQGNIEGAIAEMERAIALAPGRWEANLSLALLQLKNNQPDAAEANLKQVIALNPTAPQAHVLLGSYYQSRNRLPEAEQQIRQAIAVSPTSMVPREALARLYLVQGKDTEAEEVLEQARHDLSENSDSSVALSSFYFMTGKLDKATAVYAALYEAHPHDTGIKKRYIQLLIQQKQYVQAAKLDNEILRDTPSDDDALLYRSQMQISGGDINDAAQSLESVVKNAPNNSDAHYVYGLALEQQGFTERAESEWREAVHLNPDFLDAQRAIAGAAVRGSDMNELQTAATQLIRLEPASAEGYSLHALSNMNLGRYVQAEEDARKAIAVDPKSALGYVQLGNLRMLQGRNNEALDSFQEGLTRNPNSLDALRGVVRIDIAEKQADRAIAFMNSQIMKTPNNSNLYTLLGTVLFHSKNDLSGAQKALERATALDQHNPDAVIQLSQVHAAKGEVDQAISIAEQSLRANTHQPNLYILLGSLYESQSAWQKAQNAYQSALALSADNPFASNDLARVMLHTGEDYDLALSLAQTARRGLPDSPSVLDTMGWIYFQKGAYPLAVSYLEKALSLQERNKLPDDPEIHYHLGLVYEKTRQSALARQQLEHVLQIDPNYNKADQIREELIHMKS